MWSPWHSFFFCHRPKPLQESFLILLDLEPLLPPVGAFEPDGSYGDVPYKVNDSGSIDAILAGSVIRFREVDQFLAAAHSVARLL
jgi:hypothetical protein